MQLFKFLSRHPFDDSTATAFADGELDTADAAGFEEHLRSCEACGGRVAEARAIRRAVASLPEVAAPRSFAITPEMAASGRPAPARVPTPMYVNLARAGAALSVAAFGAVFAVNTLQSSEPTSSASQDADTSAALGAGAPVSNESTAFDDKSASPPASDPTPEPTPGLAPVSGGGASGSGGSTVTPLEPATAPAAAGVAPTLVPSSAPQPPSTGPGSGAENQYSTGTPADGSRSSTVPEAGGVITDAVPADSLAPAVAVTGHDEDDSNTALWVMGAIAALAVAGLAVIEITRRRHSP